MYNYAAAHSSTVAAATGTPARAATDYAAVSAWALDAVNWCYAQQIMTGDQSTKKLNPQNTATRAEICKMSVLLYAALSAE
jgi:hypothetical protein